MVDYYYLDHSGQPAGPVSAELLRGHLHSGLFPMNVMVVPVGETHWRPAFQETALAGAASVPPHPGRGRAALKWVIAGSIAGVFLCGSMLAVVVNHFLRPQDAGMPAQYDTAEVEMPDVTKHPTVQAPKDPPAPSPQKAATTGTLAKAETESTPATPSAPVASGEPSEDPMGEWYEFGYAEGALAADTLQLFGIAGQPDRRELTVLIQNLNIEPGKFRSSTMDVCYQGYEDGYRKRPRALKMPKAQKESILPEPMRLHSPFAADVAAKPGELPIEKVVEATVKIITKLDDGTALGSGFFFASGRILTNHHVIEDARSIEVYLADGRHMPGKVLAIDDRYDAAIVGVELSTHPRLSIAQSNAVHIGDEIAAVGFPEFQTISATATFGRISSTDRHFGDNPCFQIDLTINHGNSGGPLVDKSGRVIGINTFSLRELNIDRFNFAIKIDDLVPLMERTLR